MSGWGQPLPFAPGFFDIESRSEVRAIPDVPSVDRRNGAWCQKPTLFEQCDRWRFSTLIDDDWRRAFLARARGPTSWRPGDLYKALLIALLRKPTTILIGEPKDGMGFHGTIAGAF
jgi:hypothetical protein